MPRGGNNLVDISGAKYGCLTVVRRVGSQNNKALWLCTCVCGGSTNATGGNLRSGQVRSCGCKRLPPLRTFVSSGEKAHDVPEYSMWRGMITRCENPNSTAWKYYGARGISVAPQWRRDFRQFLADMGRRPSPGHSIDRIDNDGNYEPGNCRWATAKEQVANRRPPTKRTAPLGAQEVCK